MGCAPTTGGGATAKSSAPTLPTIPYAPSTTSATPAPQAAVDYQRLLLSGQDLTDAEDTFLAHIEFDRPVIPWLFSPTAAAGDQLVPWIALVVLEQGTNVLLFKVVNEWGMWEGCVRLVDEAGRPAEDIRVKLTPES